MSLRTSQASSQLLAVLTAAVLFKLSFLIRSFLSTIGYPSVVLVLLCTYLFAFALLYAALADVDMAVWNPRFATGVVGILLLMFALSYTTHLASSYIGTDAMLFTRYAVDLVLSGQNPYTHSMESAFQQYPIDKRFVTYRIDGEIVTTFSYPALAFLAFVPQALLGIPNLNLTTVTVLLATLVFLVYESPTEFVLAPFVLMFVDPNLTLFSFGGVFDILWVFLLLLGMKYWTRGDLRLAAIFVGLAFAVKQIPWFVAPFLAVWLYAESETYRGFAERARTCIAYGLGAFLLPNLPFIVLSPVAWLKSVFTPVAGSVPMVKQGIGLTMLTSSGLLQLPKSFYTLLLLGVLGVALVAYFVYFERLRWVAWVVPMAILWVNYRSLQNYFIFFVPIAYYAVLCRHRAGEGPVTVTNTREETDVQAE